MKSKWLSPGFNKGALFNAHSILTVQRIMNVFKNSIAKSVNILNLLTDQLEPQYQNIIYGILDRLG